MENIELKVIMVIKHILLLKNENWWKKLFTENKFRLKSFSYNIEGIKDKWYNVNTRGNGFFKLISK